MSELVEFLLARIAEDEALASAGYSPTSDDWELQQHAMACGWKLYEGTIGPDECDCGYPRRVLTECAAKRRIVAMHQPQSGDLHGSLNDGRCLLCVDFHADMDCEQVAYPCPTVRALASAYANHADFREEWGLGE